MNFFHEKRFRDRKVRFLLVFEIWQRFQGRQEYLKEVRADDRAQALQHLRAAFHALAASKRLTLQSFLSGLLKTLQAISELSLLWSDVVSQS